MRKANQEIKDPEIIEQILAGAEICRIAMIDGDVPYMLPFNYGYRDQCIYIHSAPAGKKIELLKKNSMVCFEIEQTARIIPKEKACKWATLYRSVVGYGQIEIIDDVEGKKEGLAIIMTQHGAPDLVDFEAKEVKSMVILKLSISSVVGKQSGNWEKESSL